MCKNFTCPQNAHCQPQRAGPTCECETYKRYNSTTRQCQETDHCAEEKPVCSHMCENKGTYFMCSCDHGYIPDMAKYLCFAPGKHLSTDFCHLFSLSHSYVFVVFDGKEPVRNVVSGEVRYVLLTK